MAVQYTRKKEEKDVRTVAAEEFINLMLDGRRQPDRRRKTDNTEMPK